MNDTETNKPQGGMSLQFLLDVTTNLRREDEQQRVAWEQAVERLPDATRRMLSGQLHRVVIRETRMQARQTVTVIDNQTCPAPLPDVPLDAIVIFIHPDDKTQK